MSKLLKVPPTKSTLILLKRQVSFLEQGQELLERKRELLSHLVYEYLSKYRELRKSSREALGEAYNWLSIMQMRMDDCSLEQATQGANPSLQVDILPRRHLGVEYPAVTVNKLQINPVGLMGTDSSFDETRTSMTEAAVNLAKLGEIEMALGRLMDEQRKTQIRVNALKYNIIPSHHKTIRFILDLLEEGDRESLFQLKVLRDHSLDDVRVTETKNT